MNRLKKELKKRGISLERFKFENAYILAEIFKDNWTIQEIVNFLLDIKVNCFHLKKSKFTKKILEFSCKGGGNEEWFITEYLDEMAGFIDEDKVTTRKNSDDKLSLYM